MTKTFDCVEMKREGQEYVKKLLDGKTKKEVLSFWRTQTELFRKQHKQPLSK